MASVHLEVIRSERSIAKCFGNISKQFINLNSMIFEIKILHDKRYYQYKVERTYNNGDIETYTVYGKNKNIEIKTNRQVMLKKGLKHREDNWTIHNGQMHQQTFLNLIIEAIKNM